MLCITNTYAQDGIHWYSLQEVEQLAQREPRKVLISIYTNWDSGCKKMESSFSQAQVARYINANYYAVRLNAEEKATLTFRGKTYKYVQNGNVGYHELAAEFLNGQMSYPTVVFLDEGLNFIQAIQGYRAVDQFEMLITYFGDNNHKKMPWTKYEKTFVPLRR